MELTTAVTNKLLFEKYFDLVSGTGLRLRRNLEGSLVVPPEKAYLEMAQFLRNVDDTTEWAWADLLNVMPKSYGQTYNQVSALSGLTEKTLANRKHRASLLPEPEQDRRLELTPSHHGVVCDYEMPAEMRQEFLDDCVGSMIDNDGVPWSVAEFRKHVRSELRRGGFLDEPSSDEPPPDPEQENYTLKQRLYEERDTVLAATAIMDKAKKFFDENPLGPEADDLAEELENFVQNPYPNPSEINGYWKTKPSVKGGDTVVFVEETPIGEIEHDCDKGLPPEARNDLHKRLGTTTGG